MACEVYEARSVKATRRPHTCEYCGSVIPAGSPALYEHGIYEHKTFGRYSCKDCEPFIGDFWDYMDYEAYDILDDFSTWIDTFRVPHPILTSEIECPSCGKVRVMRYEWEGDGFADCPKCGTTLSNPRAECD